MQTEDQIKAQELLREAVDACVLAYAGDKASGIVVSDFVVLAAAQVINESNNVQTGYPIFMSGGGDIPWYRALGLLEVHKANIQNWITSGADNG